MRTLDLLPKLQDNGKSLRATIRAAAKRGAANDKPKALASIPKMKQVAKLATGMGLVVTGFTQNGDGGFTVATGLPVQVKQPLANPWDEVLK